MSTELIRYHPENPYELVSKLEFASMLPVFGFIGPAPLLADRPIVVAVTSSLGRPFVTRRCPGALDTIAESECVVACIRPTLGAYYLIAT